MKTRIYAAPAVKGLNQAHIARSSYTATLLSGKKEREYLRTLLDVAVPSTLRPCMDVFASPEKSNMAVTESDPDSRVQKIAILLY